MWIWSTRGGIFYKGFTFTFFTSQEPFTKIKTSKFCCPHGKQTNHISIRSTWNYFVHVYLPTHVCQ